MASGLYYYKLVSPYSDDVTKNCKLTINEIDSNFFNLKSSDVKSIEFIRDEKVLVLTRMNDEKLFVDLSSATYDLDFSEDVSESGTTITLSYDSADGKKVMSIENLMTFDDVKKLVKKCVTVLTDDSLTGFGNISSPLGIKRTEKTGMLSPASRVVDVTLGERLPSVAKLGTRIITKEYLNDYGYLYNGSAVRKIGLMLDNDCRGWRVPSKADWDKLLNSIEPCKYRNHDSVSCHVDLGKYAGKFLKSECGWVGQDDCTCNITSPNVESALVSGCDLYDGYSGATVTEGDENIVCGCQSGISGSESSDYFPSSPCVSPNGVDKYGFTVLPSGMASLDSYGRPQVSLYKEKAFYWTTTAVGGSYSQDSYVKEFVWNKSTVSQTAECPMPYYSLRLVKDYDGSNYLGAEYIDGVLYETVLHAPSGQIWLVNNYSGINNLVPSDVCNKTPEYVEVNGGNVPTNRKEYFINEWNGVSWEKKQLKEGDSIVIENPFVVSGDSVTTDVKWVDSFDVEHSVTVEIPFMAQHDVEYRVFTSSESCDKELLNSDDLVVERVINVVVPMIEAERNERIVEDGKLLGKINDEAYARTLADNELATSIEVERTVRSAADEELWNAVNQEVSARTEAVEQLWDSVSQEISARTEADAQLSEAVEQLSEALEQEVSARTEAVEQLSEALEQEVERATAREDEIDGQLISSEVDYVIKSVGGIKLVQKNGNVISIGFDGNYGEI